MTNDFGGDVNDFSSMTDDEIRDVVLERLRGDGNINPDEIDVIVRNGAVTLAGRVGTDTEVEIAASLLDDVLGLEDFSNELMVDPLRRDAQNDEEEEEQETRADAADQQSDTAEHLVEDLESETFGTEDLGQAIRDGSPYTPPEGPFADGYGSREDH